MKNCLDNVRISLMKLKRLIVFLIITLFTYVFLNSISKFNNEEFSADFAMMVKNFFKQEEPTLLVIPKLPKNSDERSYFKEHWKSDIGYFVLIKNDLETKASPDIEAENYDKLYQTQRVQVLFENKQPSIIDQNERYWVFLGAEDGSEYLGWTFKDQLTSAKDFEVFSNLDITGFSFDRGQMSAKLSIKPNGRFYYDWNASGEGLILKGQEVGQLYISDDIIWTKKDDQDYIHNFFILDDTNHIYQEFRFRNEIITMNLYQLP